MTPIVNGFMLAVSSSLAASVVGKVTVTTALGLAAARVARGNRAAVRHTLLAAVFSVLLLLPIASAFAPPVSIAVTTAMREAIVPAVARATDAVLPTAHAYARSGAVSAVPQSTGLSLSAILLAIWLGGIAVFLLPVVMGLWQIRSLRRSAFPWRDGRFIVGGLARDAGINRSVEVLLHEAMPGPMTCGIVHPAIVLPRDADTWAREDLDRAIVHELEHVRRADWLSQCFARGLCAVYWFHPLVWIAWRQLGLEAERACDDAVIGRSDATAYADQLVGIAERLSAMRKVPALAMANRADLATRVGAVLDNRQRRGRAGRLSVALACAFAALVVLTISPLRMVAAPQLGSAQSSAETTPKFDAVSVKLIDPSSQGTHWHEHGDAKYLSIIGSVHGFILRTYGIRDAQLTGEPGWFNTRLYQIEAVTSAPSTEKQRMLMLRDVLAERFQLRFRQENRDLPVFSLEVAAGGPKFRELKPGEEPVHHPKPPEGTYARTFTSIGDMMNQMNGVFGGPPMAGRPVLDRTHLTANYDMHLETEWRSQPDASGDSVPDPDLARDMQSELGLKLVPERGSMPCFVVDHAEAPTPN